ncbi:MAG: hypothetical protein HQK49_15265 [Oligoflexia bacterium]|nr:hypothetical protein [Oligoflexia bacterium]
MIKTLRRFILKSISISISILFLSILMTITNLCFSFDSFNFQIATEVYGPVIVKEGTFSASSMIIPWSSYWFPTKDPILFKDENSALRKYDRFVEFVTGKNPESARYHEEMLFNRDAVSWSGLCTTWSLASIMEIEPKESVSFKIDHDNVLEFSSGDLKALLIQSYTKVEQKKEDIFGQRFDGVYDSIYADIFPMQFHRLLQAELFDKKLPIIIDTDAGIEVWNSPIWYAKVKIVADSVLSTLVHVTTDVYYTSDKVTYNFRGAKSEWRRYTYDLKGSRMIDGQLLVDEGVWTGNSISDHPDYVRIKPSQKIIKASFNEKIDPKMVELILKGEMVTPEMH